MEMKKSKKRRGGVKICRNILKLSKIEYGDQKSKNGKGRGQNMLEYTKTKPNVVWR